MIIKPFRGYRPVPEMAASIACRPYDVLNSEEAREEARGNPHSFLNVVKPEISLPADTDPHSAAVYHAGRDNFRRMVESGAFIQDNKEHLYIYELSRQGHSQDGVVACAAVQDYLEDRIKKHELTRPDKENDRKDHIKLSMLNAEPVFFAYKSSSTIEAIVAGEKNARAPVYDFTADDGVRHRFWVIDDAGVIASLTTEFSAMQATYVADGHHRTAAAARAGEELAAANPSHTGSEEYNFFLAVHFPDNQLQIIDYNRVVRDLNGLAVEAFLQGIEDGFTVTGTGTTPCSPQQPREIGMYLQGEWYRLNARPHTLDDSEPVAALDVTILSRHILEPLLGIHDQRRDERIEFIGGTRGLQELERRVDNGEMAVAFAMYPVTMQQLMAIADSGMIMPPKVTWFEPKLRSGLIVHSLEG